MSNVYGYVDVRCLLEVFEWSNVSPERNLNYPSLEAAPYNEAQSMMIDRSICFFLVFK